MDESANDYDDNVGGASLVDVVVPSMDGKDVGVRVSVKFFMSSESGTNNCYRIDDEVLDEVENGNVFS